MSYFLGKGATVPVVASPYQDPQAEAAQSGDCRNECYDRYNQMLSDANVSDASAMSFLNRCLGECVSQPQATPKTDESAIISPYAKPQAQATGQAQTTATPPEDLQQEFPEDYTGAEETTYCQGGHKLRQGIYIPGAPGMTGCAEGFKAKFNQADGWTWCCPEPGPGDFEQEQPDGEGGAGCIPITRDYAGGAGAGSKYWNDPAGVIPANTVMRSGDWQGHMVWHVADKKYYLVEDLQDFYQGKADMPKGWNKACPKGYHKVGQECCPDEAGAGDDAAGTLGEFKWPAELYDLYNRLIGRAGEFMDRPPGFSPEMMHTWFGRDYDRIRGAERTGREAGIQQLQSEGLLGTGASQDFATDLAWGTEKGISDLARTIFLANEQQTRSDLLDFTGAAGGIFGQGQQFIGGEEAINAGRRQESMASLMMFMQYLSSLMQSWGA